MRHDSGGAQTTIVYRDVDLDEGDSVVVQKGKEVSFHSGDFPSFLSLWLPHSFYVRIHYDFATFRHISMSTVCI